MNPPAPAPPRPVAPDAPPRTAPAGGAPPTRVCALLTCFNRRESTLACLRALAASDCLGPVRLHAVLVDDGSSDGTAAAVRAEFPWVEVLQSDGTLYWCRGMHLAFARAVVRGHDHYLWLNDDTVVLPDALRRLLDCEATRRALNPAPVIVVGTTVDPRTGLRTYGGERTPSTLRRFKVEPVAIGDQPQRCDTFNGNIVLVPALAARRVGNLDPVFEHAMGDTDYGLRARRLDVDIWAAAGVHGRCAQNPTQGTHRDPDLSFSMRWRRLVERKGLPIRSWMALTRSHSGVMWPLYFAWPYTKFLAIHVHSRLRGRIRRE